MSNVHVSPDVRSTISNRKSYINYNKKFCMTSLEEVIQRGSVKKLLIKLRRIQRKTPVPESILNKVAGTQICNFIKKRFQYSCFLVILRKF